MPECFLAKMPGASPRCDGRLVRCHVISKQVIRKEIWHPNNSHLRYELKERVEAMGNVFPRTLYQLQRDPRTWVWGCGGIVGNAGHHGELDTSRTLRIPRYKLPAGVEEFAATFGLMWWLDREYGAAMHAAVDAVTGKEGGS